MHVSWILFLILVTILSSGTPCLGMCPANIEDITTLFADIPFRESCTVPSEFTSDACQTCICALGVSDAAVVSLTGIDCNTADINRLLEDCSESTSQVQFEISNGIDLGWIHSCEADDQAIYALCIYQTVVNACPSDSISGQAAATLLGEL